MVDQKMQLSDSNLFSVVDRFTAAALGADAWEAALTSLASITGSRGCQLVGFNEKSAQFNLMAGLEQGLQQEIERLGGTDPRINPRLLAGLRLPVLQTLTDADLMTTRQRRHHRFYNELATVVDLPYFCATTLTRDAMTNVGLATIRNKAQGEISAAQRRIFSQLAPHVRSAVRTQALLEQQGAALVAGALNQLKLPVFICDQRGRVRALTAAAEQLVGPGGVLELRGGVLQCRQPGSSEPLITTLAAALQRESTERVASNRPIPLDAEASRWLEVIALPSLPHAFTFEASALVIACGRSEQPRALPSMLLQSLYQLTPAEAEVAQLLANGLTIMAVAEQRHRTRETIRCQAKAIYAKLGVRSQSELVALLARLAARESAR